MNVRFSFQSDRISVSKRQQLARDFARRAQKLDEIEEAPAEPAADPTEKGEPITVGSIVLAVLGSSAIAELIKLLRSFLDRDTTLKVDMTLADGSSFSVTGKDLDSANIDGLIRTIRHGLKS